MKYHLSIAAIALLLLAFRAPVAHADGCNVSEQIVKAQQALQSVPVTLGTKLYRYTEQRSNRAVKFNEPEAQIALALLDPVSCAMRQVTITKRGAALVAPSGYDISVVRRANGIQWNYWATQYEVRAPRGWMVIANKYPLDDAQVIYTAYSDALGTPLLVANGRNYLSTLASQAFNQLQSSGIVLSPSIEPDFVARLAPIEQMDLGEFLLDPAWATERFYVLLGANRERTASYTCNKASACGLMQFTPATYALMVKKYPAAKLTKDFVTGARDPLNAMKAAFLLHEYNLAVFKKSLSTAQFTQLLASPALVEESLSSAYNTGASRTLLVLKAYFAHPNKFPDWAQAKGTSSKAKLVAETKGYISKLRYVRDQWTPSALAASLSSKK
jgi:hypothetical protein